MTLKMWVPRKVCANVYPNILFYALPYGIAFYNITSYIFMLYPIKWDEMKSQSMWLKNLHWSWRVNVSSVMKPTEHMPQTGPFLTV